MDRLRGLFEDLGFDEVSSVLASGNVIFTTQSVEVDGLRQGIESRLKDDLGYEVETFLRTPAQLAAISAVEPAGPPARDASVISHYVIFLHEPASEALRSELVALGSETDSFQIEGREVHWRIRGRLPHSPVPILDRLDVCKKCTCLRIL